MASALIRRRISRDTAVIGVSLLAHGVVLVIIGLNAPKLAIRFQASAATDIWLMPRPIVRTRTERREAAAGAPAAAQQKENQPKAEKARSPTANAPAPGSRDASPAAGPPGATGPGAGVIGALRASIGCDIGRLVHLSPEETDRCNQRLGEAARKGPTFIDAIPPEKRAYYDAVQAAYQAAADPMHPSVLDRYGNVQPWGKGPGVGCGMKFGGPPQPPDHRSVTDKIKATGLLGLDLGPLRCGVVIPQGSMTPEVGIPVP